MSTSADDTPAIERLRSIVTREEGATRQWQESLPALRARSLASKVILREMARTSPLVGIPRRGYADVLIAAPDEQFVRTVKDSLRTALPEATELYLASRGEGLRDAPSPQGFIARLQVALAGMSGSRTTGLVRDALSDLGGVEIDYNEPLDLIVVSPRAGSAPQV